MHTGIHSDIASVRSASHTANTGWQKTHSHYGKGNREGQVSNISGDNPNFLKILNIRDYYPEKMRRFNAWKILIENPDVTSWNLGTDCDVHWTVPKEIERGWTHLIILAQSRVTWRDSWSHSLNQERDFLKIWATSCLSRGFVGLASLFSSR